MMNFLDYKRQIGFDVSVHIRDNPPEWCNYKFYTLADIDVITQHLHVISLSGDGNSADEALQDFVEQLSGQTIRYKGVQYEVPELTYTVESYENNSSTISSQ